jgi:hypothetical protein
LLQAQCAGLVGARSESSVGPTVQDCVDSAADQGILKETFSRQCSCRRMLCFHLRGKSHASAGNKKGLGGPVWEMPVSASLGKLSYFPLQLQNCVGVESVEIRHPVRLSWAHRQTAEALLSDLVMCEGLRHSLTGVS